MRSSSRRPYYNRQGPHLRLMLASLSVHLQGTALGIIKIAVRSRYEKAWGERDLCLFLGRPGVSKSGREGHKRRPVSSMVINKLVVTGVFRLKLLAAVRWYKLLFFQCKSRKCNFVQSSLRGPLGNLRRGRGADCFCQSVLVDQKSCTEMSIKL